MDRKKISSEAAAQLGIKRPSLMGILLRKPWLRPAEKLPNGDYLWSNEEIEAVAKARRPSGRPPKQ
jgi:hypothetical protein